MDTLHLASILEQRAASEPANVLYSFVQGRHQVDCTAQAVFGSAQRAASHVKTLPGYKRGQRVLLHFPDDSGHDFVAAFWGSLYAGAVPVVCDWDVCKVRQVAKEVDTTIVLTNNAALKRRTMSKWKRAFSFQPNKDKHKHKNNQEKHDRESELEFSGLTVVAIDAKTKTDNNNNSDVDKISPSELACLLPSTTRDGQLVRLSHHNLLVAAQRYAWLSRQDNLVNWMPPHTIHGLVQSVLVPVLSGCRAVSFPATAFYEDPTLWMQIASKFKAVHVFGPSSAFAQAASRSSVSSQTGLDLRCVRSVEVCEDDGVVHVSYLHAFMNTFGEAGLNVATLHCSYGSVETFGKIADSTVGRAPTVLSVSRHALEHFEQLELLEDHDEPAAVDVVHLVSTGVPLAGVDLCVVHPVRLEEVPSGVVGEIWVRASSKWEGYWNSSPNKSNVEYDGQLNGVEYLRTGDMGAVYDNELYHLGHRKDIINLHDREVCVRFLDASVAQSISLIHPGNAFCVALSADNPDHLTRAVVVIEVSVDLQKAMNGAAIAHTICTDIVKTLWQDHEVHVNRIVMLRPGGLPMPSRRRQPVDVLLQECKDYLLVDYNHSNQEALPRASAFDGFII